MSDESLPPFQPSPLGLQEITPATAKRPGRKAKTKKEKKPRKVKERSMRMPASQLTLVSNADIAAAAKPEKKPRKKRKAKAGNASPGMANFLKVNKMADELARMSGKDRDDVLKLVAKLFK